MNFLDTLVDLLAATVYDLDGLVAGAAAYMLNNVKFISRVFTDTSVIVTATHVEPELAIAGYGIPLSGIKTRIRFIPCQVHRFG